MRSFKEIIFFIIVLKLIIMYLWQLILKLMYFHQYHLSVFSSIVLFCSSMPIFYSINKVIKYTISIFIFVKCSVTYLTNFVSQLYNYINWRKIKIFGFSFSFAQLVFVHYFLAFLFFI